MQFGDYNDAQIEPPKKKSVVSRVLRYIFYAFVLSLYMIFFLRFFAACDSGFSKILYVRGEERPDAYMMEYARRMMTDDGSFSVVSAHYVEDGGRFQVVVKYNDRILKSKEEKFPFDYKLVYRQSENTPAGTEEMTAEISSGEDAAGEAGDGIDTTKTFTPVYRETASRMGYNYVFVGFEGVDIPLDASQRPHILLYLVYEGQDAAYFLVCGGDTAMTPAKGLEIKTVEK